MDGLFERINERIKMQIEKVEEMTGDMDPKTNFALIVIQTELERYKYLVRSYLRARIAKVRTESSRLETRYTRGNIQLTAMGIDRQAHTALPLVTSAAVTALRD